VIQGVLGRAGSYLPVLALGLVAEPEPGLVLGVTAAAAGTAPAPGLLLIPHVPTAKVVVMPARTLVVVGG
jgi:hypothetical protein